LYGKQFTARPALRYKLLVIHFIGAMPTEFDTEILERIAAALERLVPPPAVPEWDAADAFVWDTQRQLPLPVREVATIPLKLIWGVDQARDTLLANTRQFAQGYPANNALLWGARGMGKSSLVKSIHAEINTQSPHALALVEIHREDIAALPLLMHMMRRYNRRFLLFCDDLSFDSGDASYKSLKVALEGGVEGRPQNVIFYATSNRRHMLPREMIENETSTAIHPGEAVEEKVSLSDRFGLWIGFHPCSQDTYLAIVQAYAEYFSLAAEKENLRQQALQWSSARGARSGRVAWQFIQDLAGRSQKKLV
jgi:hypothetical protein